MLRRSSPKEAARTFGPTLDPIGRMDGAQGCLAEGYTALNPKHSKVLSGLTLNPKALWLKCISTAKRPTLYPTNPKPRHGLNLRTAVEGLAFRVQGLGLKVPLNPTP